MYTFRHACKHTNPHTHARVPTVRDFADDDLLKMPSWSLVSQIAPVGPDTKAIQIPYVRLHHREGVRLACTSRDRERGRERERERARAREREREGGILEKKR
jgi:hypothetical protein